MNHAPENAVWFKQVGSNRKLIAFLLLMILAGFLSACESSRKECAYSTTVTTSQPYCSRQAPQTCSNYCDSYGCRQNCSGGGYCVETSYRTVTTEQCQSYRCQAGYIEVDGSCLTQKEIDDRSRGREEKTIRAAANADDNGARLFAIAWDYATGSNNRPADIQKAIELYTQACDLGSAYSCLNLGHLYRYAPEIPTDVARANTLQARGCELGSAQACDSVAYYFEQSQTANGPTQATQFYRLGCNIGAPKSCARYAVRLSNGSGVAADPSSARLIVDQALEGAREARDSNPNSDVHQSEYEYIQTLLETVYYSSSQLPSPITAFSEQRYADAFVSMQSRISISQALQQDGKLSSTKLASNYGGLAWYALFAGEYAAAEEAAKKGLKIDPSKIWILTNFAHAKMYLGQRSEASEIYVRNKGVRIPENGDRLWEDVIIEDFDKLSSAGLSHPQMAEIRAALR